MTRAEWRVCVDWNGDGDFGGPGEDVTGDVLGLTLDHSRDLLTDRTPAARLEMELRNGRPQVQPAQRQVAAGGQREAGAQAVGAGGVPVRRFFQYAGTRLAEHSPDYDDGFTWSEQSGGFEIGPTGVGTRTAAGGGRCVATLDYGDADVSFGCDFTREAVLRTAASASATPTPATSFTCGSPARRWRCGRWKEAPTACWRRPPTRGPPGCVASSRSRCTATRYGSSRGWRRWWRRSRRSTTWGRRGTGCSRRVRPITHGELRRLGVAVPRRHRLDSAEAGARGRGTATCERWTRWSV